MHITKSVYSFGGQAELAIHLPDWGEDAWQLTGRVLNKGHLTINKK